MEKIYFDGFEPQENIRSRAKTAIKKIKEAAPEESEPSLSLEFMEGLYHCEMEILHSPVPFKVSMAARLPGLALERAEFAMLKKLDHWRRAHIAFTENSLAS